MIQASCTRAFLRFTTVLLALCALLLAPRTWARYQPELLHSFGAASDGEAPRGELVQGADGAFYGTAPYGGANLAGTVYKVNADGTGFTVLHDFQQATTGIEPQAGLLKASNGFLYGVTFRGGANNYGTIYRMNGDGTGLTVIYAFTYATGAFCYKSLIEGADGKLYGITRYGGSYGEGVIFRIDPDGANYTVLKTLNSSTGSASESGIMFASDGLLYGMGTYRGANDHGTIFRMGADGSGFEVLMNFDRMVTGGYPDSTLVEGADGMLYGTARFGGTNDKGTVFKVNKNGTGFTVVQHLSDTVGANPAGRLLKLPSGEIYGTAAGGGATYGGVLFKLGTGGTTYSIVKDFHYNGSTAGGPVAGVVLGSDGKLYGTGLQYGMRGGGGVYRVNTDGSGYATLHDFLQGANLSAEGGFPAGQLLRGLDGMYYGVNSEGGTNGDGTLFKINGDGSGFTVLKHFESAVTGNTPISGLIQTPDGKLYGTTTGGGATGGGTLFRVDTDGTDFEVLVQFQYGSTGNGPRAPLLLGQDGKIYGVTYNGYFPGNGGAVFKVNTDGTDLTILKGLNFSTEGALSEGGLSQGPDGTLYGCATNGGVNNFGAIFKLNPDGTGFALLQSGNYYTIGGYPVGAPVVGNDGALYGCMNGGGGNYGGTLYRVNTDGSGYTTLRYFDYTTGGGPRGTLVKAADGSLYGATQSGGAGEGGVIFKTNPDGTGFTVLGSLTSATHGRYVQSSLTFSPDGSIYANAQFGGTLDSGTVFRLAYIPNTAPAAAALSSNTVPENASFYNVGTLGASADLDGDAVTYSLVDGGTFPDNASFFINGRTLFATQAFDFETKDSYSIRVRASDGSLFTDETLTVQVTDQNDPPTGVSFANATSIVENTVIAAPVKVADIVVADDAPGTNYLYLSGANAASFSIVGTELFLNAGVSLDFETRPTLSVTVNVDDYSVGSNPDASRVFTLTVLDDGVNEGAYGVSLSGTSTGTIGNGTVTTNNFYGYGQSFTPAVAGSAASGGTIGTGSTVTLSAMYIGFNSDAYATPVVYLYSSLPSPGDLASGIGALATGTQVSGRNYSFPDVPLNSSQTYYVLAPYTTYFLGNGDDYAGGTGLTDTGGQIGEFGIDVPFTATFGGAALTNLPENADTSSAIKLADIGVLDDALGSNSITISGADAASFTRIGNALYLNAGTVLDHETKPTFTATIEVDDSEIAGSPDFTQVFTLTIRNVNEAPTGTNKTVTTPVSTPYAFTKADFGFTDPSDAPNSNVFNRLKITTLPAAGTLTVNGSPVNAGDFFDVNPPAAGEVWNEAPTSPSNVRSLVSSADGSKLVAISDGDGKIYLSTDSGATWAPAGPTAPEYAAAVTSSADGVKLVAVVNGGQIYTSTDSGATWTARADGRSWSSVASSADGTKLAAGVGYYPDYIYLSNDSGVTWTATTAYGCWTALAMSADGSKIYAGDSGYYNYYGGYFWSSNDSGATWTVNYSSYTAWQSIACSSDGAKLVAAGAGSYGGALYTSADFGATLTQGPYGNWKAVASSADGNRLLAVDAGYYFYYGGPTYTSSDAGATWVQRSPYGTLYGAASSADGTKLAIANYYGAISTSAAPPAQLPVFTPAAGAEASPYASFTFQVEDNGGTADGGVNLDPTPNVMTINVSGVAPNTPPVLNLPASPVIAEATSAAGAVVSFSVTATDTEDDPDPAATANPPSGSTFPLGDTTVNVSATDSGGATTNGSFIVRVRDTTAPTGGTFGFTPASPVIQGNGIDLSAPGWSDIHGPVNYQFYLGATPLGSAGASNTRAISPLPVGSYTVSVEISDQLGNTRTEGPLSFSVVGTQTIDFTLAATAVTTDTIPLSATGGASGNEVTFSIVSGPGSLSGNTLSFTGTGSVIVRASQAGNTNYLAASDVDRTVVVSASGGVTAVGDRVAATSTSILIDVLKNDSDSADRALSISAVTQPAIGKVMIEGNKVRFTPPAKTSVTSALTFTYTARAGSDTATATVTIVPPPVGTYLGLLSRAGTVRGRVSVTVNAMGTATGSIRREGGAFSFKGSVLGQGGVTFGRSTVPTPTSLTVPLGPLDGSGQPTLNVTLADTTPGQFLTGTAERSPYDATHPAPQAGRYTMVANLPGGGTGPANGAALVCSIATNGAVTIGGRLGDNTAATQGGNLLSGGRFPFYVAAGSGAASRRMTGELVFDRTANPAVTGDLHWKVSAGVVPQLTSGVDQDYTAFGLPYVATNTGVAMFSPSSLTAFLTLNLPTTFVRRVSLDGVARNGSQRIYFSGGTGYLSPGSGFFSGTYAPSRTINRSFFGVVLRGGGVNAGRGNLMDSNAIRTVTLTTEQQN